MWIYTVDGFFSAVQNNHDHSQVMVRARQKEDLERMLVRLEKAYLGSVILENIGTDYAFRIFVDKEIWADYLAAVADIDYGNFKGRALAKEPIGSARDRAYHQVWGVMKNWQDGGLDPKPKADNHQLGLWDSYQVWDETEDLDSPHWPADLDSAESYDMAEPSPDQFSTPLRYEKALERWALGLDYSSLVDASPDPVPDPQDYETDEAYSEALNLWLRGEPYSHLEASAANIGPDSPFWLGEDEMEVMS